MKKSYVKRIFLSLGYFIICLIVLFTVDYVNVLLNKVAPRFAYLKEATDNMIIYRAPFYQVYRINRDTLNEYYIIDTKGDYTEDSLPVSKFNRDKAGIDNIIKYKNKYVGNNSNIANLVENLPLAEYGFVLEIDSTNFLLTVDYQVTDWYINEDNYLERALLYNSVSIFSLIDNVREVTFNFSGKSFKVSREQIDALYPDYEYVIRNGVDKNAFNKYVENKMNNSDFVVQVFNKIFAS